MKKILSLVLCVLMILTYVPAIYADSVPAKEDNVIYSQDFSNFYYHVNDFDEIYGGRYIVLTTTASDGVLNVNSGNRYIYETHALTERKMITGGVIKAQADFVFTDIKGAKIMATYKSGGSNDGDATGLAYMLRSTADKTITVKAFDKNGNTVTKTVMEGIETNKKYTFAAYMDLDTGRLQIQADGKNVLLGEELYISKDLYTKDSENEFASANINRLFETRSDNGGEYTVDNIKITREAKLPVSNYSEAKTEWEDDFETFSTSNYAAAYVDNTKRDAISSSNNLIDFATLTNSEDTQKHGNILELKNARLLKQLSGTISGTYSVKADMYFTNTAANGLAFSINAKDSSVTAARLRVKDGYLKLQKGGNDIAGFKYETDTWYSVEVVFNTDTLDINAMADGKVFASGKMNDISSSEGAYTRIFENDNASNTALDMTGIYIDNVVITKNSGVNYIDSSNYKTDIVNENFDSGSLGGAYTDFKLTNPIAKDGAMEFTKGTRMIKTYSATEGAYVIDTDIKISDFPSSKARIFGTAAIDGKQWHMYNIYAEQNSDGTGTLGLRAYTYDGIHSDENPFITNLKTDEWINLKVSINLNTGRIFVYANGIQMLADRELYIGGYDDTDTEEIESAHITRMYDFDNRNNDITYSIDNLRAYRDTLTEAVDIEAGIIETKTITLPETIGENKLYWYSHSDFVTIDNYTATITMGTNSTAKYPEIEVITEDTNGKASRSYTFCLKANVLDLSVIPEETTTHINTLPFVTGDGTYLINWTSSHPEIITDTGAVTRPKDTTIVTLTANYSEIESSVDVNVLGMNTEDKIFATKNKLYANDVLVTGKSDIKGKTVKFEGNIHNATPDEISVTPIIAIYDSVGDLVEVVTGDAQTIPSKTSGTQMTLTYNVKNDDTYRVQAMMWNMGTLKPLSVSTNSDDKKATLYVLAASTYANYADDAAQDQAGIGMYLDDYIDDNITVVNKAIGGRSTRSYLTEGRLNDVLKSASEGDYTLICFGGNDTTVTRPERYVSKEDFPKFLDVYRRATIDRGIIPFFVGNTYHGTYTPATETTPSSVTYENIYEQYNDVMKEYTASVNVPMADIYTAHGEYLATLTPDEVRAEFIYEYTDGVQNNSFLHFNKTSAKNMAKILTGLIKEINVNGLSDYITE